MVNHTAKTGVPLRTAVVSLSVLLASAPLGAFAQTDLRNTFPGRRMGGGTRGECSARLVANLVPASSVFAPGASKTIGILEGPTAQPRPLQLVFKPADDPGATAIKRDLAATGPGVTLLTIPSVQRATLWETGYRCDAGQASGTDMGLDFVETASPPAQSLLVLDAKPDDQRVAATLQQLKASCGKTVPSVSVVKAFGIEDVMTPEWPQQLPVRCL